MTDRDNQRHIEIPTSGSVVLYCDGSRGRPHPRYEVAQLLLVQGEGWRWWVVSDEMSDGRRASGSRRIQTGMDGDTGQQLEQYRPTYRVHHQFPCGRRGCRVNVPVADPQRLYALLDDFAQGGVSDVSLIALAARLQPDTH